MNFRSRIRNLVVITGAIWGLSLSPVQANVVGSMALNITDGCFSYGENGATSCDNIDTSKLEYASGSFKFNNTLSGISNPAAYAYQATITLQATSPTNPLATFDDARSKSFASLDDLTTDPLWSTAYSFVTTVMTNSSGSFETTIPTTPPMGPFTASWTYETDADSTTSSTTGSFKAWSSDNLNGLSQFLFGQALPVTPIDFSLNVTLAAVATPIPEPAIIALIGLGILGVGMTRRHKTCLHPIVA